MALIYLVAGEASGDVLGGRLMAALRARAPDLNFAGVGGPRMGEQGLESLFPLSDLAVMGLVEVLPRLLPLRRRMDELVADIAARRPDILVTIDSPGFTLRLLRRVQGLGIRRVHYVAPQVWAWHEERVRTYPGLWDRLLCLLPFEPGWFARRGLEARFVGHPVLESGADQGDATRFRAARGLAAGQRVLVLMPGSRRSEVPRLLPVFGATLRRLAGRIPDLAPVLPVSPIVAETVERAARAWPVRPLIVTAAAEKHDAYAAAGAALTKSGTSTLELALAGVPMAVTYRVNPLSAAMARRLIRVPYVAMVNLLAARTLEDEGARPGLGSRAPGLVPELLQGECAPATLTAQVERLLDEPAVAAAQRLGFADVIGQLRAPRGLPSEAAAAAVLDLLD